MKFGSLIRKMEEREFLSALDRELDAGRLLEIEAIDYYLGSELGRCS
jgi:hypothetical protein